MTLVPGVTTTTAQAAAALNRQSALDRLRALLGPAFATSIVTTDYGVPAALSGKPHTGIDLAAAEGTPIQEPIGGTVEQFFTDNVGGTQLVVRTPQGYREVYAHLMAVPAFLATTPNAGVPAGAVIGYVGQTGMATGPHLHYEVTKPGGDIGTMLGTIDPLAFISEFAASAPVIAGDQSWRTEPKYVDTTAAAAVAKANAAAAARKAAGNPLDALAQFANDFGRLVGDLTDPHNWAKLGLTLAAVGLIGTGTLLYGRSFLK